MLAKAVYQKSASITLKQTVFITYIQLWNNKLYFIML
jgi:hypothetical protein